MPDQTIPKTVWYDATPAQQGLWILDRIERLRPAYLIPSVLEFDGPVEHGSARRGRPPGPRPTADQRARLDAAH